MDTPTVVRKGQVETGIGVLGKVYPSQFFSSCT